MENIGFREIIKRIVNGWILVLKKISHISHDIISLSKNYLDYIQGESMLNLLRGKKQNDWRKSILFEYYVDDAWPYAGPDQLAVRTNYFKLVDNFIENDIDELYDLKNDPGEMINLINVKKFDKVENELRKELIRLQKKYKYNPDRDWWLRKQTKK